MQAKREVKRVEVAESGISREALLERGFQSLAEAQFGVRLVDERSPVEVRSGRLRQRSAGVGEILSSLRSTLQEFISAQIDNEEVTVRPTSGFGFGHHGFEGVDCKPLVEATCKALRDLGVLYETLPSGRPDTLPQRDAIIETQALLQQFLLDFREFVAGGALDRSASSEAVKYCIGAARGLGKLTIGFEAMKFQLLAEAAGAE
jgi:hypothetical protein